MFLVLDEIVMPDNITLNEMMIAGDQWQGRLMVLPCMTINSGFLPDMMAMHGLMTCGQCHYLVTHAFHMSGKR